MDLATTADTAGVRGLVCRRARTAQLPCLRMQYNSRWPRPMPCTCATPLTRGTLLSNAKCQVHMHAPRCRTHAHSQALLHALRAFRTTERAPPSTAVAVDTMPQEFCGVRCFSCGTFQVQLVKKTPKFACSLCGQQQQVAKQYAVGRAADVRQHVQRLNMVRAQAQDAQDAGLVERWEAADGDEDDAGLPGPARAGHGQAREPAAQRTDWSAFVGQDDAGEDDSGHQGNGRRRLDTGLPGSSTAPDRFVLVPPEPGARKRQAAQPAPAPPASKPFRHAAGHAASHHHPPVPPRPSHAGAYGGHPPHTSTWAAATAQALPGPVAGPAAAAGVAPSGRWPTTAVLQQRVVPLPLSVPQQDQQHHHQQQHCQPVLTLPGHSATGPPAPVVTGVAHHAQLGGRPHGVAHGPAWPARHPSAVAAGRWATFYADDGDEDAAAPEDEAHGFVTCL